MYNYKEFTDLISEIKSLAFEYKDKFNDLSDGVKCCTIIKKIKTTRTIHNISCGIRPDFMSIHHCMSFFDNSFSWKEKKTRSYSCIFSDNERLVCIHTEKKKFVEFYIYKENHIILIGYAEKDGRYNLESIGISRFKNESIIDFSIAEIKMQYCTDMDIHLNAEQYIYSGDRISELITYDYINSKRITVNFSTGEFNCNITKAGYVISNPEIYRDKFIYKNEELVSIKRSVFFNSNIAECELKIKHKF